MRRKATERDAMRKTTAVGAALDEQLVQVRQHKHRKFQQDRAGAVSLRGAFARWKTGVEGGCKFVSCV